jgi:hypothetical protein
MTDNQFQELFRLVTTAVNKISSVEEKVDNLQTEFHEFRDETRNNFQRLENSWKKTLDR